MIQWYYCDYHCIVVGYIVVGCIVVGCIVVSCIVIDDLVIDDFVIFLLWCCDDDVILLSTYEIFDSKFTMNNLSKLVISPYKLLLSNDSLSSNESLLSKRHPIMIFH